ncbi:MAG: hypothetical protein ACRC67_15870 [Inquilinus sp.]|uniref:hypothetical protein n=1 Tax=Inquilinus sp. TaxID=1932117 RepID=UPI003F2F0629
MTDSEELRRLRKAARIARQITRKLNADELAAYIERSPQGAVMPVHATDRQWRDLVLALSAADKSGSKDDPDQGAAVLREPTP